MDNIPETIKEQRIHFLTPIVLQAPIYILTFVLFKIFCNFKVSGLENIRDLKNVGVIFAANHSSEWDGVLTRVAIPFLSRFSPMYYVSLEKKHYSFSGWRAFMYGGAIFRWLGAYPAYRGSENYEIALRSHIQILRKGRAVCIFPEGKKNLDGNLGHQAQGGVSCLAHVTNSPIVPVFIDGVKKLTLKNIVFGHRKVSVTFGKPIGIREILPVTGSHSIDDYRNGATFIMSKVKELSNS